MQRLCSYLTYTETLRLIYYKYAAKKIQSKTQRESKLYKNYLKRKVTFSEDRKKVPDIGATLLFINWRSVPFSPDIRHHTCLAFWAFRPPPLRFTATDIANTHFASHRQIIRGRKPRENNWTHKTSPRGHPQPISVREPTFPRGIVSSTI